MFTRRMRNYRGGAIVRGKGQCIAEIAAIAPMVCIFALLSLDICFLLLGALVNDAACRDGARAASGTVVNQTMSDVDKTKAAIKTADAVIQRHKTDGAYIGTVKVDEAACSYVDYGGTPSQGQLPKVTIATKVCVKVPVPIAYLGAYFGFDNNGTMTFSRQYSYPIGKLAIQ